MRSGRGAYWASTRSLLWGRSRPAYRRTRRGADRAKVARRLKLLGHAAGPLSKRQDARHRDHGENDERHERHHSPALRPEPRWRLRVDQPCLSLREYRGQWIEREGVVEHLLRDHLDRVEDRADVKADPSNHAPDLAHISQEDIDAGNEEREARGHD